MADPVKKGQETYDSAKDKMYQADQKRYEAESKVRDVENTARRAGGFIGWLKSLFGMK